jgi:glycosyltransferase involved in cell wall biosynthesis
VQSIFSLWEKLRRAVAPAAQRGRRRALAAESFIAEVVSRAALRLAILAGRWLTYSRLRRGRVRSVWGVTPILTLRVKARCDQLLGIESEAVVLSQYYVTRKFDRNLAALVRRVAAHNYGLYQPTCRLLLAWALMRFDLFNYFADRGFLPPENRFGIHHEELVALRASGKRLYVYTYGADVRTRRRTLSSGPWNLCGACPEPGNFCICDDDHASVVLSKIAASATAVIAMADMPRYVPGCQQFDYWPIDIDSLPCETLDAAGPFKIAHAPNSDWTKGSQYLIDAVNRLRAEGEAIELVQVHGVPNEVVLRLFASATVVADQFISGAFGYTALEAMAIGRPVLCFLREPEKVLGGTECPIINASPDEIYDRLRWCLANRGRLVEIGRAGRRYVEHYHSIAAVARRLASLYSATAHFPPAIVTRIQGRASELERHLKTASPGTNNSASSPAAASVG